MQCDASGAWFSEVRMTCTCQKCGWSGAESYFRVVQLFTSPEYTCYECLNATPDTVAYATENLAGLDQVTQDAFKRFNKALDEIDWNLGILGIPK